MILPAVSIRSMCHLNSHLSYWANKRKVISRKHISSINAPVGIKKIEIKLASAVKCKKTLLCCVRITGTTTFSDILSGLCLRKKSHICSKFEGK